jgi:hypothetical protein
MGNEYTLMFFFNMLQAPLSKMEDGKMGKKVPPHGQTPFAVGGIFLHKTTLVLPVPASFQTDQNGNQAFWVFTAYETFHC